MSGTLALASAIAAMDQQTLSALVLQRRPQAAAGVSDPIGLASELLRTDALLRALAPLDRDHLCALIRLSESASSPAPAGILADLTQSGLVGLEQGRPCALPEVTSALTSGLSAAGAELDSELLDPSEIRNDDRIVDTSAWYAAAVTSVGQASEILRLLMDRPGKLNRNGSVAVAAVRLLAEASSVEASEAGLSLRFLENARLITASKASLLLRSQSTAPDWLATSYGDRWIALATATIATMPVPLRATLEVTGSDLMQAVASLAMRYPLLPRADLSTAEEFARAAEHLGLTVEGVLSPPARALLSADVAAAQQCVARDLPAVAPGIYVQPDLSLVIPGPLAPADEAEVAALSRPEHIGIATSRRVTEASLAEAIERGVTADAARATFTRLSLTGVPQPLDYLLTTLAERVGTIVVEDHLGDEGRTKVTVSRPELAQTILVDRGLQHVQFQPGAANHNVLFSRLRVDHVLSALNDARYPATLGGSRITVPTPLPSPPSDEPAEVQGLTPELHSLVERVFLAARSEPGTGDFTRLLELAIRERGAVRVTAEARGQVHTFTLQPVSLSGGRLRATDVAAGMERTLPVSMITAVETVGS